MRRCLVALLVTAAMSFGLAACASSNNPISAESMALGGSPASLKDLYPETKDADNEVTREFFAYLKGSERDERMRAALELNGPKVMDAITSDHLGSFTASQFSSSEYDPKVISGNLILYITKDEETHVLVELEDDGMTVHQFVSLAVSTNSERASIRLDGQGIAHAILQDDRDAQRSNSTNAMAQQAWKGEITDTELELFDSTVLGVLSDWTAPAS